MKPEITAPVDSIKFLVRGKNADGKPIHGLKLKIDMGGPRRDLDGHIRCWTAPKDPSARIHGLAMALAEQHLIDTGTLRFGDYTSRVPGEGRQERHLSARRYELDQIRQACPAFIDLAGRILAVCVATDKDMWVSL